MNNFIVSYDLNGSVPSHKQVDEALVKLGAARGRILETVWWVGYAGSAKNLFDALKSLMSDNDQMIVVEASQAVWENLKVEDDSLLKAWEKHR